MISSEIYAVIDGIWYDNFSSDTLWRYMNGRVNTVYNDGIEVTITGASPYVRIRQNYLPLSQVKGKTVHFEYTVEKPSNKTIQATIYKEIDGNYVYTNSQYTTENTVSLEVDVGEEVTNIIFQMSLTNFAVGETLKLKEVKVYLI